jgi:hypothetical protein
MVYDLPLWMFGRWKKFLFYYYSRKPISMILFSDSYKGPVIAYCKVTIEVLQMNIVSGIDIQRATIDLIVKQFQQWILGVEADHDLI